MERQDFDNATKDMADQAWHNAMLFELLAVAYSAVARNRFDEWQDVLIKISQLPKDDLFTAHVATLHETVCDRGWSNEMSMITSELYDALTPSYEGEQSV